MKKVVGGLKDENGVYIKLPGKADPSPPTLYPPTPEPGSIDEIGEVIILGLSRAVKHLTDAITHGDVRRDVVGALKDCEAMHREISKKEKEFLSQLSDEELQKLAAQPFKTLVNEAAS